MADTSQSSLFELALDQESIGHLTETARWGKFLAIVGFVMCGLIAIFSFFIGSIFASALTAGSSFSNLPRESAGAGALGALGGVFFTAIYLVFAALYFFPCLFLYNFSVRMKTALNTNDQVKLNQSLKAQKILFRYVGILTIVLVSTYGVLLLIVGVIAALSLH
jgi:hypothetical protein